MILDADTKRSLQHLSANTDWLRVQAWVERTLESSVDNMLRANQTVSVHQQQGYCSALRDFLQAVRSANPSQ